MEQLKPIVKYHFWILCGIIVLTTIGAGFWAMSGQASVIGKQVQEIRSAKSDASGVMKVSADVGEDAAVSVHPNDDTNAGMESEIDAAKEEVMAAWTKLYNEQKDLLDWPLQALPEDVAKVFDPFYAERMPFELDNLEYEAPKANRMQVKEILPRVLPRLADQIRAKWLVGEDEDLEGANSDMFNQPVTEWSANDQAQWEAELTAFRSRNGNEDPLGTPTTMQVLYAKENLILLNGVLEILNTINKDATTPGQATVKKIQSILIGEQAHSAKRLDLNAISKDGGGGGMSSNYQRDGMRQYMENFGKTNKDDNKKTVSASDKEKMDPAHMRYVNEKFEPIPASEYRKAVTSKNLSDKSWMSIVKRVPVRLTLMIDERNIDDILEACANGKIPLEVRQITLVGGKLPTIEGAGGDGADKKKKSRSSGIGFQTGGMGAAAGALDPNGSGGEAATGKTEDVKRENYSTAEFNSNFEVPVEIYGFMKIYNEPTPEAIGAETVASE